MILLSSCTKEEPIEINEYNDTFSGNTLVSDTIAGLVRTYTFNNDVTTFTYTMTDTLGATVNTDYGTVKYTNSGIKMDGSLNHIIIVITDYVDSLHCDNVVGTATWITTFQKQ